MSKQDTFQNDENINTFIIEKNVIILKKFEHFCKFFKTLNVKRTAFKMLISFIVNLIHKIILTN